MHHDKSKIIHAHVMKIYGLEGGVLILNRGSRWRSAVSITLQPPYPRKRNPIPLCGMLGGHQSRSGRFGEEKNIFPLPGLEPWTVQPLVWSLYTLRILITYGRWKLSVTNYILFFPLSRLVKYCASREVLSNLFAICQRHLEQIK